MGLILDTNFIIAATALANGFGVMTNIQAEFNRVPGLTVEGY